MPIQEIENAEVARPTSFAFDAMTRISQGADSRIWPYPLRGILLSGAELVCRNPCGQIIISGDAWENCEPVDILSQLEPLRLDSWHLLPLPNFRDFVFTRSKSTLAGRAKVREGLSGAAWHILKLGPPTGKFAIRYVRARLRRIELHAIP